MDGFSGVFCSGVAVLRLSRIWYHLLVSTTTRETNHAYYKFIIFIIVYIYRLSCELSTHATGPSDLTHLSSRLRSAQRAELQGANRFNSWPQSQRHIIIRPANLSMGIASPKACYKNRTEAFLTIVGENAARKFQMLWRNIYTATVLPACPTWVELQPAQI